MKHNIIARILHWSFIVLFAYGLSKGLEDVSELNDFALFRFEMQFAKIFIIVVLARFMFMTITTSSALPKDSPLLVKVVSKTVHIGMYVFLVLVPVTGIMIGRAFRHGGDTDLPVFLHESSLSILYVLITLHIIGAVYHRFLGDGVWSSMVPFFKEKK